MSSATFWRMVHGGSTHFPIVLLLASVALDVVAWRSRDEGARRGLQAAALGSAAMGTCGGIAAVIASLMLTHGRTLGTGSERAHHLFVWPASAACVGLTACRVWRKGHVLQRWPRAYLAGMSATALLMGGAGYSGGELLLGTDPGINPYDSTSDRSPQPDSPAQRASGKTLFVKNCAHCHGADASGGEGPDLHSLDLTDEQIVARIRNGKKGQMTAFAGKLSPNQIRMIVGYLRSLRE